LRVARVDKVGFFSRPALLADPALRGASRT
jgi:hypothetical protein